MRKIRPAAQTMAPVVTTSSATDSSTCQSGGPGGIAIRRIIANGVIVGNSDKPTASADSGVKATKLMDVRQVLQSAAQARDEDVNTLFYGIATSTSRVTRMRADLVHAACERGHRLGRERT